MTEIAGDFHSDVQVDNAEGSTSAALRDEKFLQMGTMKIIYTYSYLIFHGAEHVQFFYYGAF
jgi:hypothetical protein